MTIDPISLIAEAVIGAPLIGPVVLPLPLVALAQIGTLTITDNITPTEMVALAEIGEPTLTANINPQSLIAAAVIGLPDILPPPATTIHITPSNTDSQAHGFIMFGAFSPSSWSIGSLDPDAIVDRDSIRVRVAYDDGSMPDGSGWGPDQDVYGPGGVDAPGWESSVSLPEATRWTTVGVRPTPVPTDFLRVRFKISATDAGAETHEFVVYCFFNTTTLEVTDLSPADEETGTSTTPTVSFNANITASNVPPYQVDAASINVRVFRGNARTLESAITDGVVQSGWTGSNPTNGFSVPVSVTPDNPFDPGETISLILWFNDLLPWPMQNNEGRSLFVSGDGQRGPLRGGHTRFKVAP